MTEHEGTRSGDGGSHSGPHPGSHPVPHLGSNDRRSHGAAQHAERREAGDRVEPPSDVVALQHRDRALELLAGRALSDLSDDESIELEALLLGQPELDDDAFELAASTLLVVQAEQPQSMPRSLRQRVEASSARWLASHGPLARRNGALTPPGDATSSAGGDAAGTRRIAALPSPTSGSDRSSAAPSALPPAVPTVAGESSAARLRPAAAGPSPLARLGWPVAIAASVLAAVAWWPQSGSTPGSSGRPGPAGPVALESLRDELLVAPGSVAWSWAGVDHPRAQAPRGDVVWNGARQEGVMRIGGLSPNDPKAFQYQLWIFDKARDERFPVDGGVFDVVDGAGDVLIPIRAALPVSEPALFAVTVEPPGGVVVSDRDVVLAAAP
ncbi:MAG TPA: hypothetical protein PKC43_00825 [Phycisphaerales bacterium]|nr:hypothetical protein [Phycisphaerales bacterium]HMP35969.1 hypothetical protein [Phycisphaerales bacterium]